MADETAGSIDTGGGGAAATGSPAAATPITLSETSSFIPPGGKEPLTWDKFQSSYVSKDDLTRMRQRDATERQSWQQQTEQRLRQEYEQRFRQPAPSQPQADPYKDLEAAQWVDGKTMAQLMRQHDSQRQSEAGQLVQAIQILHQQNQQLRQQVTGISGKWSQNELSSTFANTKTKLGLPDDPIIDELLQDVYHSHTGWETDPQAFETTVATRWKGIQAAIRNADRLRADQARQSARPFAPGAPGGAAKPGKPLLKGNESAEDLANRLWTGLQTVQT